MEDPERIKRVWQRTRFIFFLFPFWIILIMGINIWSDAGNGKPFNWENVVYPALMLAFSAFLMGCCWMIFRFIASLSKREDHE